MYNKLNKPIAIPGNRCIKFLHVIYGLLLRVQFGCLLQQLLLGAQIGLAHACARSFSSSCELSLNWLSQNACKDAREQEKGESCKTWATPLRTRIRRMPEKIREQFCEIGSAFGSRFGTSFGFSFGPRSFNSYCSAQKRGPKLLPKLAPKQGPIREFKLALVATIHRASTKHGGGSAHEKYNAELRRKFFAALKGVG